MESLDFLSVNAFFFVGVKVPGVSKGRNALIFRVKQSKKKCTFLGYLAVKIMVFRNVVQAVRPVGRVDV